MHMHQCALACKFDDYMRVLTGCVQAQAVQSRERKENLAGRGAKSNGASSNGSDSSDSKGSSQSKQLQAQEK